MAKTSKTSDKRGKKSGEISEEKLDKVAGGATAYATMTNLATASHSAGSIYETGIKVPTVPTKPILKP